jgi:DNA-binding beta-propeller fold protein YncE
MTHSMRRLWLGAICVAMVALAAARPVPAHGDAFDPISGFPFFADRNVEGGPPTKLYPPPGSGFKGPCGLAVDSHGNFYVADYYHHYVDVFDVNRNYLAVLQGEEQHVGGQTFLGEDPSDGPCGLAVDGDLNLYINNFHRNVVKYSGPSFPFSTRTPYEIGAGTTIDSDHPTGVALDPASENIYVDDRTYIAVYEPSGAPVLDEGVPLKIGLGSLEDGYGVAVSNYSGTKGYVYVADAGDDTIKIYDPATDTIDPVATIDGHATPKGSFVSLRDTALAVYSPTGRIYVADDLQPEYFERPEAAIYAFEASGTYAGRLKFNVFDARPPGLAVDDFSGRVYVTSGNSDGASVYAYEYGALTTSVFPAHASVLAAQVPAQSAVVSEPTAAAVAAVGEASPPRSEPDQEASRRRIAQRKRRLARQRHHTHRRSRAGLQRRGR